MGRAEGRPAFTVTTDTALRALLRTRPRSVGGAARDQGDRTGVLREARRVAAGGAGSAGLTAAWGRRATAAGSSTEGECGASIGAAPT